MLVLEVEKMSASSGLIAVLELGLFSIPCLSSFCRLLIVVEEVVVIYIFAVSFC